VECYTLLSGFLATQLAVFALLNIFHSLGTSTNIGVIERVGVRVRSAIAIAALMFANADRELCKSAHY